VRSTSRTEHRQYVPCTMTYAHNSNHRCYEFRGVMIMVIKIFVWLVADILILMFIKGATRKGE